jgi:transcriptional regulator with XRE-family HTH domain
MKIRRCRLLRLQGGFTQKQLANKLNVSPNQLSYLEKGNKKIGIASLYKLAELLGWSGSPDALLDEIEVSES